MHLEPRRRFVPDAGVTLLGRRVRAESPTASHPVVGTVVEADGNMVSVQVAPKLIVVVDVQDCHVLTQA